MYGYGFFGPRPVGPEPPPSPGERKECANCGIECYIGCSATKVIKVDEEHELTFCNTWCMDEFTGKHKVKKEKKNKKG